MLDGRGGEVRLLGHAGAHHPRERPQPALNRLRLRRGSGWPEKKDIGILASWDPAAIDQASVDLVLAVPDGSRLAARIREHGFATLEHAEAVGLGRRRYRLLKV